MCPGSFPGTCKNRRVLMSKEIKVYAMDNFKPDLDLVNSFADEYSFCDSLTVFPGFCDVHVHFREPGFSYKETIKTGSLAAAHGGYTDVCTMPNLDPVPDSLKNLSLQTELIERDSVINIHPYGSITVGEKGEKLSDMENLSQYCIAFSDDGHGVQSADMMKSAMFSAKRLGKMIVAHCEDNSLLDGGYIHKGDYARLNNHRGISSESEWMQIKRDLSLCEETGCSYHICHISTRESVSLIRDAKKKGIDVTCETAPHYLLLDDGDLKEDGFYKMNPPLRSKEDKSALIEGIIDGTVDMIATDHAPHSTQEKSRGLEKSLFGITGIETAFPLLYTGLVKKGIITLDKLIELICINPRKRFGIAQSNDFSLWNLDKEYIINSEDFLSKGKATPFLREKVYGKCLMTVCGGKKAYICETGKI